MGRAPGGRLLPPGVPVPRRAGHPRGDLPATPTTPRSSATRSTTSPGMRAVPQPRGLPAVRRPAQGPVRRRRDPEPGVGLTYWSHRLSDWSDLWTPDGNIAAAVRPRLAALPGRPHDRVHRLAGRHRPRVRATGPVRHHVHRLPAAGDRRRGARRGARRHRRQTRTTRCRTTSMLTNRLDRVTPWTTSGVPGLFRQADRLFSSNQSRFFVTETDAQSIGGPEFNLPPYPGQLRQAAFALISRGAAHDRVLALAHAPLRHRDLLGRSAAAQPRFPVASMRELAGGRRRARAPSATTLDGYEPDADVAILWSNDSRFALEFSPPSPPPTAQPDRASYQRIFDAFHRGVIDAGAQARILHAGPGSRPRRRRARGAVPGARRPRALRRDGCRPRPAARLRGGRRAPRDRHPHGLRRRGGASARRGRARPAARRRGRALRGVLQPAPRRRGRRRRTPLVGIRRRAARALGRRPHHRRRRGARPATGIRGSSDFAAVTTNAHGEGRITVVGTRAVSRRWPPTSSAGLVPSPIADELAPRPRTPRHGLVGRAARRPPRVVRLQLELRRRQRSRSPAPSPTPTTAATSTRQPPNSPSPAWSTLTLIDE